MELEEGLDPIVMVVDHFLLEKVQDKLIEPAFQEVQELEDKEVHELEIMIELVGH